MSKNTRVRRSSSESGHESDGSSLFRALRDSKHRLRKLNDRLIWFIVEVQDIENENPRMRSESRTGQRLAEVKAQFEYELGEARKVLDKTDQSMAELEHENHRLKDKLERKQKNLQAADRDLKYYEQRCGDLESQCKKAKSERKHEVERLSALLDDTSKDLKEEKRQRVKYQNRVVDLSEDMKAKERAYRHEIDEIRFKHHTELKDKIKEIDDRLAEQYESWLKQALHALREKHRMQLHGYRF